MFSEIIKKLFMKKILILTSSIVTLLAGPIINKASAQIFANDDAGVYTSWATGTNYGFGFQPWILYGTGNIGGTSGYGGTFLGNNNPTDASVSSANGNYWGSYANSASTASAEEFRAFSNSMPVNATFKIRWHNNGIGFSADNAAGFNLRNGNNTNLQTAATFLNDNSVFAFYYIGGGSDNYVVYDGNGVNTVPITYGNGSAALTVEVTLLPGGMYNLIVENGAGTSVLYSANDQPLAFNATVDSVAMYAFDTGGNQDFNDPEIFMLAPQVVNLTPPNGTVYDQTIPLTFAVTSSTSTILASNIQLILNGTVVPAADLSVLGSGTSSNQVQYTTDFQENTVYNGTIIATDQAGNSSTNTFTFNTWETAYDNIYIEAGDYNYGGGQYFDNALDDALDPDGSYPQPNQNYGQFDVLGEQGIDYNVYDLAYTNNTSPYRSGDLPYVEPATDIDHNNFANNGFTPFDLGFNEFGQWEDYTRELSNNITYAVYARVSGFPGGTISLGRMATPTVSTSSQPGATLGQFNVPNTGGAQDWTFVPLTDFFSNPVLVNFGGTNTFRITDINGSGSYNLGYLLLVAVTNNATLRPYITSGYPYPGANGAGPEQSISFTIANEQTSVNPASIQLFLNSNNITSSSTLSNNAAGTLVSYQPVYPNILQGGTNTLEVIFSDGSVSQTDTWQFTAQSLPTLPTAWALPLTGSYSSGFSELIAKADDSSTNIDFPPSVARAIAQLNGTLTNSQTGVPYANEALNGGTYIEKDTINYALDPSFDGLFYPTNPFPDVVLGETNYVAMEANMYVYLTPGVYNFDVYSDDGFQFSAMNASDSTNTVLGVANFGRAPSGTEFSFIVATAGLYPMQLIYFKSSEGGGGVELYSVSTTGANILLNDSTNPNAVPVYYLLPGAPTLAISPSGTNVILTWNDSSYVLQHATDITGPYTTINGSASPYPYPIGGSQQFFRLVKSQ